MVPCCCLRQTVWHSLTNSGPSNSATGNMIRWDELSGSGGVIEVCLIPPDPTGIHGESEIMAFPISDREITLLANRRQAPDTLRLRSLRRVRQALPPRHTEAASRRVRRQARGRPFDKLRAGRINETRNPNVEAESARHAEQIRDGFFENGSRRNPLLRWRTRRGGLLR
jgi:hypothetical protein